jgi:hypothetical protein
VAPRKGVLAVTEGSTGAARRILRGVLLLAAGARRGAEAFGGRTADAWAGLLALAATHVATEVILHDPFVLDAYRPPADSWVFWVALPLLGTAGFMLASRLVAAWLGLRERWRRYIAAWAWLQALVSMPVVAAVTLIPAVAQMPEAALWLLLLLAIGVLCWIGWMAAVAGVGGGARGAIALIAIDAAINAALFLLSELMAWPPVHDAA